MAQSSLFSQLEVYNERVPRSAAMNMAIDEALLESAAAPSIRFYRWNSPALSFGYFGRFADVAEHRAKRDLVRRWTGGGIVLHGDDLTYSLIIPAQDAVSAQSSMSIYEKIHRALRNALIANGEAAELATVAGVADAGTAVTDSGYHKVSQACFANPVRADVIVNGQKVAGAAQRRVRGGLLHQGSIQYIDVGNGLAERFVQALSADCSERKVADEVLDLAWELALQKYGTDAWLRRR